jgi:hypothetical protein
VRVASELLELTGPTDTGGLTNRNVFEGADEDDEVYDTAGWSDDKKRALSAIVRFLPLPCTKWPRVRLLTWPLTAHDTRHTAHDTRHTTHT